MLPPETTLADLERIQDEVRDRFPVRQERSLLQFQLEAKQGNLPEVSQASGGVQGYLFLSSESEPTKVLQARLDGFAFSKLKPYEDWSTFRNEAKELWDRYTNIVHPTGVTRLGLRTINRINLPLPFRGFNQYILTLPDIAPGLPKVLSEFFMQLVMPQSEPNTVAIITVATNAVEASDTFLPIIFDIDVFVHSEYVPESDMIWSIFEELRHIKNDIFFRSITEETKELFR
jgi:uncharacterized protein (TIGR04255 family)